MPTKAQYAQIHIAKKELRLHDENYRDILFCNFQVDSSKDLKDQDVPRLLNIFRGLGWQPGMTVKKPTPRKQTPQKAEGLPYAQRNKTGLQYPVANDPECTIHPDQQAVINGLVGVLGWSHLGRVKFNLRTIKKHWPQNHAEGQKLIYAMIAVSVEKLLSHIETIGAQSNITEWERGFLRANEFSAEKELKKYIAAKNARGRRTMPRFSMLKLLEIIKKRNIVN